MNVNKENALFKYNAKTTVIGFILFSILIIGCKQKPENKGIAATTSVISNNLATLEYKIKSKLGEGAFWNYKTKELYWVDIAGQQFHIYNPKTKQNKSFAVPSKIGTVVPYTKTEAIIALEDGVYTINLVSGKIDKLSDVENKNPNNRFNDGKCDPSGNLWVGTISPKKTVPKANLFKIEPNGKATKMLDSIKVSNGIVWTSDAKTMYYIDTPTAKIKAFDFDKASNTIKNERTAVVIPEVLGYPDGMAIDEEDMLWVGMWKGNGVIRFNPKTGKVIRKIEVPAYNVTSCAFGGENLDELYITTASIGMTAEEKKKYPLAGSIFKVKPGVRGVKSSFFGIQK